MKILLIKDSAGLGTAGQIKEVADGFAKNFLIPQGLVLAASEQNLKAWQTKIAKIEKEKTKIKTEMEALAQKINQVKLVIQHRSAEENKLFGAVTSSEIAEALKSQANLEIDRKKIILEEPIKHLGKYQVPVKLEMEVSATINLTVEKSNE